MPITLTGRYSTQGSSEGEFEPGSKQRVLKNFLGINKKRDMDITEWETYNHTIEYAMNHYARDHRFTSRDILHLHEKWLGSIYPWAGKYRQVNIAKGNFHFAAAAQIPKLMKQFEKNELKKYTPCLETKMNDIITALAIVHIEFILIHPFRDGNGRLGRLIAIIMGSQADLPILDFGALKGKKLQDYFHAVQMGHAGKNEPMEAIFTSVIKRSFRLTRNLV